MLTNLKNKWASNLSNKTDQYRDEVVPTYYSLMGQYYSDNEGPYLLGDRVTYVDFAVYQSIDNDERTGTLPVSHLFQCMYTIPLTNF
jgi:glutathione S-transferase